VQFATDSLVITATHGAKTNKTTRLHAVRHALKTKTEKQKKTTSLQR